MKVKMLTPRGLKVLPPEGKQGIKAEFPWVGKKIRISREGLSTREGTFSFNWLKDRSNSSVKAILDSCGVSHFLVIVTKPHDNLQKAGYLASGSRGLTCFHSIIEALQQASGMAAGAGSWELTY